MCPGSEVASFPGTRLGLGSHDIYVLVDHLYTENHLAMEWRATLGTHSDDWWHWILQSRCHSWGTGYLWIDNPALPLLPWTWEWDLAGSDPDDHVSPGLRLLGPSWIERLPDSLLRWSQSLCLSLQWQCCLGELSACCIVMGAGGGRQPHSQTTGWTSFPDHWVDLIPRPLGGPHFHCLAVWR